MNLYHLNNNDPNAWTTTAITVSQFNTKNGENNDSMNNNIEANPEFMDLVNGDYHLQSSSLAINSGTTPLATADFDGNSIPYSGTLLDIGLYEYQDICEPNSGIFTNFFKGWLDEFRLSNIIRTEDEILNYYQSNQPFVTDANTIGLWHFDENSGTSFVNSISGNGTLFNGASFTEGKFNNAVYFDGVDDRGDCNLNIPEDNITFEFWAKLDGSQGSNIISAYGMNNTHISLSYISEIPEIEWSTGETTSSITINPNTDTLIWVSDGTCTDTMIFANNFQEIIDTTYISETIYDTTYVTLNDTIIVPVYDSISVIDTLIIDASLTGINPPNNINTIRIYPNPAKTHIYINNGNYNLMNGYSIKIDNSAGQTVYTSEISQQEFYIDLSGWSGNGTYFVYIIDNNSDIIEIKKIIIQ